MNLPLTVDASWYGPTGIGRFANEVLRRAPAGLGLREIRKGAANASPLSPVLLATEFLRGPTSRAFWSPGFMPPLLPSSVWQSITVHDLTHLHYYDRVRRAYYNAIVRSLMRRMDTIFTVSEYTRQEILSWARIPAELVVAIPHGLDTSFCAVGPSLDLGRPYILYVGNRRPYKNLPRLIEAFARTGLPGQGFVLALSGTPDAALNALAESLDIAASLHFLGAIPEAELPAAYRGAYAVAFVSLYEGFGFPILEGMGCGVPVLTSNCSSMPEVAGGAGFLVHDPTRVDEIAAALERICTDADLRSRLRHSGLARAAQFDWGTCADAYWSRIGPRC